MPTDLVRRLTASGWDWVVVESDGGGGDLPAWWTLNNTPGAESVEFAGNVIVAPTAPFLVGNDLVDMEIRGSGDPGSYATLLLWDPAHEGTTKAVLEFGSAAGGTNNPGRLSNDGSAYFSTTIPTNIPLEVEGAGSWGDDVQTAPYASIGDEDEFVIGPTGVVTIYIPSDPDAVALNVSVDDLKNGSYQYAEFGSDSEWTARLFLNGLSLKGLTGEGETKVQMSHRDGTKALNIGSGESSYFIHALDDASDLFIVSNLGDVKISPDAVDGYVSALNVQGPDGMLSPLGLFATWDGQSVGIDQNAMLTVNDGLVGGDGGNVFSADPIANKLGFFKGTAVVKPTGVAVTAGGIHAALVTLGLIAA